jgi:hypothetical protein
MLVGEVNPGHAAVFHDRARCAGEDRHPSLTAGYLFTSSRREREEGLLLHGVHNLPQKRGVDESYPAGDYYFIEALHKQWRLEQKWDSDLSGRTDAPIREVQLPLGSRCRKPYEL